MPNIKPYHFVIALITFNFQFLTFSLFAQPSYEQLTINNGLPGNSINSIMQDSKGFVWVASAAGFARYDGHRFKTFRYEINNPNSIKGSSIKYLQQSANGNIWVCQHAGLSKLNTTNWQIQNYFFADSINGKKYDWEVFQVYEGNGKTLIASSKGLREMDDATHLLLPYSKYTLTDSINTSGTSCFIDYDATTLLIGTWRGIVVMNKQTGLYQRYHYPPIHEKGWEQPGIITAMYLDNEKNIWLGWWGGALTKFDLATKQFNSFSPMVEGKKLKWLVCADIKPSYKKNKLYVTDHYQNAYLFDTKTYEWQNISPTSVKGTNTTYHGLLEDNEHILWLGTSDGLFKADPRKNIFESFQNNIPKTPGADNGIAVMYPDGKDSNYIWLTGYNAGNVFKFDLTEKKLFPLPAALMPLQNKLWEFYQSYCRAADDNLWISCSKGIYIYSEKTNSLKLLGSGTGNEFNIASQHNQILKTKNGVIYIGGYNGLQKYNPGTRKFISLFSQTNGSKEITDLCEDRHGNIWLAQVEQPGKAAAITKYNPTDGSFKNYNNPVVQNCIYGTGRAMRCIYVRDDAAVYIGTSFGLFKGKLINDSLQIQQANGDDGFFAGEIHNITAESDSIIWLRTSDGIYRHHIYHNSYSRFTVLNGMLNNFPNSIAMGNNRELFLGYQDGNIQRLQTSFFDSLKAPQVFITGFKVYGIDFLSNGKDVMQTDNIAISYKQNNIRFEFTALDYTNTEMQLFKYKLEGYDKDWITTNQAFAVYNNLDGGSYIFRVKACSSYGNWNEQGASLKLYVKPPFWKTNLFILSSIVLSGLLLWWLYKNRIAGIRKQAALKEQRLEAEMIALRSQMNPHFIFNCLNTIDGFIVTNKPDEASELLQKFSKLIRQVLENSNQHTLSIKQDCEILKLYVALEKEVMENKFDYSFFIEEKIIASGYTIPSLLLQPFVENAILHGLRHRTDKEGVLRVSMALKQHMIEVTIEDNGIGRKKSAEINAKRQTYKNSMGISIAENRLRQFDAQSTISYTDIAENDSTGTIVKINFLAQQK